MNLIKKQVMLGMAIALMMGCAASDEKELFNGEDLSGWVVYGTEKWYVEDGILVSESGPDAEYGYLGVKGINHYASD